MVAGNSAADHFDHLAPRGPARLKTIGIFGSWANAAFAHRGEPQL